MDRTEQIEKTYLECKERLLTLRQECSQCCEKEPIFAIEKLVDDLFSELELVNDALILSCDNFVPYALDDIDYDDCRPCVKADLFYNEAKNRKI